MIEHLTNLQHLSGFAVILIFCAVMLWLILRDAKIVEFDVNVQPDLLLSPHGSINRSSLDPARFQIIRARRTKRISKDRHLAALDAVIRGKQLPVTLELAGRKLTFVIDGRDQIVEGRESSRVD